MVKPIVFGGYVNGYGIIRSFANKGIKSILIERKGNKSASTASRYVEKTYYFSDPDLEKDNFLMEMIELGKKLAPNRGMLFPTHDEYVITLWKNQELLEKYFDFPMSEWNKIRLLINKKELYSVCEDLGIAYPKTKEIKSYEEYKNIIDDFMFPIIIKPSIWNSNLIAELGKKVLIFNEKTEALKFVEKVYSKKVGSLLIQEYIEGSLKQMPNITVFCAPEGKIKSWSVSIKERQFPPCSGTATLTSIISPDLKMCQDTLELTKRIVEHIGFYGVCDAEYMYDVRDGKYKMIEINTRFHMQNYMVCASGVDMVYYIYCEHQKLPYKYNRIPKRFVSWCKPLEDRYNAVKYNKKKYPNYSMTNKEWKKSIPKDTIGIVDNPKDFKVYWRYVVNVYRKVIGNKIREIFGISETTSLKKIIIKNRKN